MMEYGGFSYQWRRTYHASSANGDEDQQGVQPLQSSVMLFLEDKPWQRFDTEEELRAFVDQINAALKVALKEFYLHLTGCTRCKRTMDGVKFSPCGRGSTLMGQGKGIALQIAQQFGNARLIPS